MLPTIMALSLHYIIYIWQNGRSGFPEFTWLGMMMSPQLDNVTNNYGFVSTSMKPRTTKIQRNQHQDALTR